MRNYIDKLPAYNYAMTIDPLTYRPKHDSEKEVDELEKVIFAPDPETGFPHSQIPLALTQSNNVQIREYINKYMQAQDGEHFVVTDVKEAFACMGNPWAQYGSEVDDEVSYLKRVAKESIKEKNQTKNS